MDHEFGLGQDLLGVDGDGAAVVAALSAGGTGDVEVLTGDQAGDLVGEAGLDELDGAGGAGEYSEGQGAAGVVGVGGTTLLQDGGGLD